MAPVRTVDSGSSLAKPPPSSAVVTEPVDTAAAMAPTPMRMRTTPPMPIRVLRRVRSLIHSEWIARRRVCRWVVVVGSVRRDVSSSTVVTVAVVMRLPSLESVPGAMSGCEEAAYSTLSRVSSW